MAVVFVKFITLSCLLLAENFVESHCWVGQFQVLDLSLEVVWETQARNFHRRPDHLRAISSWNAGPLNEKEYLLHEIPETKLREKSLRGVVSMSDTIGHAVV